MAKEKSKLQLSIEELVSQSIYDFKFKEKEKSLSFEIKDNDLNYKTIHQLFLLLKTEDVDIHFESEAYEYCEYCGPETTRSIEVSARNVESI